MVDMDAVMTFAANHELIVVEDAAQAHGARRRGLAAGTAGHVGCFSFYPGKNLGAMGDAGAAVTDDAEIADRLEHLDRWSKRGNPPRPPCGNAWSRRCSTGEARIRSRRSTAEACPVAADRALRQLSLPMHAHLDEAAIERITQGVAECLAVQDSTPGARVS